MARFSANSYEVPNLFITALACCLLVAYVRAQDLPVEIAHERPNHQSEGRLGREGVYLDDSFEANELIREALESAKRRDWQLAINKLDQAFKQYGRKVIESGDGIYISVPSFINMEIPKWPLEGLSAYRRRFEPAAQRLFEEALDHLDLEKITELFGYYYCTATAIQAADILAQAHLENGRFGEARSIYERLIETHPDRDKFRPEWQSKLAVCQALSGNNEAANARLAKAGRPLQQYLLDWKGGKSFTQSIVQEIEANPIASAAAWPPTDWPTFAGNSSRTLIPRTDVAPTAPLWTFDEFTPSSLSGADGYFQSSSYRSAYTRGKFLAFQPAVSNGTIFFNDSFKVWAVSLETGTLVWSYEGVTPSDHGRGWGDRSVPSLHSCTVYRARVYADLGHRPASYYGYQPPSTQSVLVCLDAATGRELWKARPADYGEDPREVEFEGPVVADDRGVYVLARRRKAFGFEDSYLWKFDHSGRFVWRTHLASGSTGGFGYRRPTLAIPTLIDGTMFIQTNLGAVAAVDVNSGLVNWISVYGRAETEQHNRWQNSRSNEVYPWQYNAVFLVPDGQLLSLPLDIEEVLILDQMTGYIRCRMSKGQLYRVHSILGVIDGNVYGVGEQLFCWDAHSRTPVWAQPLPKSPIYGRAALSASRIYVPCKSGLFTYPITGGEPTIKPWDDTQEGGNVVVLPDCILVAGNDRITLYGLRKDVFARLQRRMDANPFDVFAALNMAEVAYRTAFSQPEGPDKRSDYQRAEQALAEAVRRAGGFAATWEEQLKRRLFQDCLEFANLHLKEDPANLDAAIELLIKAGLCPPDSESLLLQKSMLASAHAQRQDYTNEIRQYHQIMSDRSLRELPWPETKTGNNQALDVCRRKIAALLERYGRELYKPFEEKASTLLAAAIQNNDLKRLDQIISVMPNSLAAPKALLAKGSILREQEEHPIQAARALYAALTRYPKLINRAEVIKKIADCYILADQPAVAWQWLTKASREFPNTLITTGEQSLTFLEYRAQLGDIRHLLRIARPRIGTQLQKQYEIKLNDGDNLLYPEFRDHRATDWSRFLIHQNGGVTAINSATGQELWPQPLPVDQRPRLLATLEHIIVLATRFEIVGLQPTSGTVVWRYGETAPEIDDPAADPENFPHWRLHCIHENLLTSSRSDGHTVCIDFGNGQVVWKHDLQHHPNQAMGIGNHLTIYRAVSGDRQIFPVISTENGTLQHTIQLREQRPVLKILTTLAGNVILVTSQSLHAVDPLTGRPEWRVQFDHNFLVESVRVVLDGIVLSADGLHILKLSLDDGRQLWRSDALGLRPSDFRLFLSQDELYVADERRVFSIDVFSGATLGTLQLPQDTHLVHLDLTDQHLALVGSALPPEQVASEYWAVFATRPAQLEKLFDMNLTQSLGRPPGPLEFYFFDHAIIGVSENALHGWTSSPEL